MASGGSERKTRKRKMEPVPEQMQETSLQAFEGQNKNPQGSSEEAAGGEAASPEQVDPLDLSLPSSSKSEQQMMPQGEPSESRNAQRRLLLAKLADFLRNKKRVKKSEDGNQPSEREDSSH